MLTLTALLAANLACHAQRAKAPTEFDWAELKKPAVAYDWPIVRRRDGQNQPLVEAIQLLLRERGHDLVVDGVFGAQTAAEINKFQRQHGLKVGDNVDKSTWQALVMPLKFGSRGDGVRALQTRLARHGYDVTIDGVFGSQTRKALGLFQHSRSNAFNNGRADARTWCFLMNGYVAP